MTELQVFIEEDGEIRCLAPDDIDLRQIGDIAVYRPTMIEYSDSQDWYVRFTRGRHTDLDGFATRGDAVRCEIQLLNDLLEEGQIGDVL